MRSMFPGALRERLDGLTAARGAAAFFVPGRRRDLGALRPILSEGMLHPYLRWAREQQDDFVVQAGLHPHVVVVRPDSAWQVLSGEDPAFERNIGPTEALFGDGLLRLEGEPWKARRQLLATAFRREALERVMEILREECDALIARWRARHGAPFKPTRELSFLMLRVLGRLLFGFHFDEARHGGRPLHAALITLSTHAVLRHFLPAPVVFALDGRAVRRARHMLAGVCAEILDEGQPTTFLDALRGAVRDGTLSRETAIDEVRTFLIAGHETTATALAWTVAVLAQQPTLVESLRAEAALVASATSTEQVTRLDVMNRAVKEVLRLFPPVPVSISRTNRPVRLGRLELGAGARIDVCSWVLHRMPALWPEPDRFDADRFLTTPAPGTWIPFLLGPHTCIGARLAMLELPYVAGRLVDAFSFSLPNGPPHANLRLSLNPAGLVLSATPRS